MSAYNSGGVSSLFKEKSARDLKKLSMKLLQLMLATGDGGAETFFEKLAIAFHDAEIPQLIVIAQNQEREKRLKAAGCEVISVPASGLAKYLLRGRLQKIADRAKPTHALAWMNRASSNMPKGDFIKMARLGGYYKMKNYTRCDHLIGITPDICRHIREAGWDEKSVSHISSFGEIPDQKAARDLREEIGVSPGHTVLLSLGRLHEVKAQDVIIKAIKDLPQVTLLLAGEGPKRAEYEELITSLGLEERVKLLGWRRDVANLFHTADLCVFPSRYEPNGNVVHESWLFNTPLIAAASAGPSWLIDHEENGILVPIDDVDGFREAIQDLIAHPEKGARLVQNGRDKFQRDFSQEVIVSRYKALFKRLNS